MAVDLTRIKVGDKVRLGGEFEVTEPVQGVFVAIGKNGATWFAVTTKQIAEHLPAPRQFFIGQRVLSRNDTEMEVRGQDGDACFLRTPSGRYYVAPAIDLTPID